MQLVGIIIINIKGAMNLHLLVLLLILISATKGRKTQYEIDSQTRIIQAKYDGGFDCVDIHKQPAFSHPLLKNHKIQMTPSFSKNLRKNEANPFDIVDINGLKGEGCPSRKVPIQRNKANGSFYQFSSTYPGQHFATLQYSGKDDIYHGARAWMSAYNPHVVDSQISAAYIWVQHGNLSNLNSIQAGWAVHPRLYGDTTTRITTYWTKDNYQKTGCYNMQCPGFVQISSRLYLGRPVGDTSTYGGEQYAMNVMIKQDPSSLNWWIAINDVQVGYWPKEIFSNLQEGATHLQYGGWVFVSPDGNSPPMGSGHFANNDAKKACYFRDVKFVDSIYLEDEILDHKTSTFNDTKCYNIIYWGYQGSHWRKLFLFGGPGGQCGT